MIERSRFASLLAIVAFLYVIIVLSKLNNPIPPDGQLIVASLYTVALLPKGSLASTLAAVLTVPLCVTSVHADETYFRVNSSTGNWWPSLLGGTTSIDETGKITIRTTNTEKVKVTLAVDKPFKATVSLSLPQQSNECKVELGTDCTPTWLNDNDDKTILLTFGAPNKITLQQDNPSAKLYFSFPGVKEDKKLYPSEWSEACKFGEAGPFGEKKVIFLQIARVSSPSECVWTMELDSSTYLLLKNEDIPTTPIPTFETTNTTFVTNSTNSTSSVTVDPPGNNADGAGIGVIVGASW
ncbi:hypothetical protein AAVH_40584 [Aphelenchoides avenae]|nr:hypothetical protein AAVH_40584 [Aphelenchus avenae]